MALLDFLLDKMPESWFNDVRQYCGESLTDEMIVQSVQEASDFFHIENPLVIAEDWTTGVYPNSSVTPMDDILIFNREQLTGMGITEQEGLDLVMTHECAHRTLQGMDTGFDSHQEELCCDFMAGVRAGLNDIDVSQMENSLADTPVSDSHPCGADRVDSIEAGVRFAQEYYKEHGVAPTFSECLDYFKSEDLLAYTEPEGPITLRQEDEGFKGYSQAEINNRVSKASHEMDYQESNMRHRKHMMESKARMGEPYSAEESQYREAQNRYNAAKTEYNKWSRMKPDR